MKILAALCSLFSCYSFAMGEICFVGATPNFFKVGHTAIRAIASRYPNAHMRLGLISEVKEIPPVVKDLELSGKLTYYTWPLGDQTKVASAILPEGEMTAEMAALVHFFSGCTAAFLVPPIDDRVNVGAKYAKAVALAKVPHAVVLGVQYSAKAYEEKYSELPPQISIDADNLYVKMDDIFERYCSPIKYIVLHLPMFLENLLYQTERLQHNKTFSWPLNRDADFAFITCKDLGGLAAHSLVEFDAFIAHTTSTVHESKRRFDLTLVGGKTNAAEIEKYFKEIVDPRIEYKTQTKSSFIEELKKYLAKSDQGAQTIWELYEAIDKGHDVLDVNFPLGNEKAQSVEQWIKEHRGCFIQGMDHPFPLPPAHHQAP